MQAPSTLYQPSYPAAAPRPTQYNARNPPLQHQQAGWYPSTPQQAQHAAPSPSSALPVRNYTNSTPNSIPVTGPSTAPQPQRTYSRSTTTTGTGFGYRKRGDVAPAPPVRSHEEIERLAKAERWRKIQENHLEPGMSNRLVLSIRSRLTHEMDFALSTLVKVSRHEPDLIRFTEIRGLTEALVALVEEFLEAVRGSEGREWAKRERMEELRRATEAMLVLRNASLDKLNQRFWIQFTGLTVVGIGNKSLLRMICTALEPQEGVEEIRGYAIEMLDIFCPYIKLSTLPQNDGEDGGTYAISSFHDLEPSVKILPLLLEYTQSQDRALVLGSYRCLGTLALVEANSKMFILPSIHPSTPIPDFPPLYQALFSALSLIPLLDADLQLAALDFIYHISCHPSNAAYLCTRDDLSGVLSQLKRRFEWGAKRMEKSLNLVGERWRQDKKDPASGQALHQLSEDGSLIGTRLQNDEMAEILSLPEPRRTSVWLKTVFEPAPGHEVLQVDLWKSYQANFSSYPDRPILVAADVIKATSDAIPGAQPQVSGGADGKKRFIINGMKVRDRLDLRSFYRCRWSNCNDYSSSSAAELYDHLATSHLHQSASDNHGFLGTCGWASGCKFEVSPQNRSNPSLRLAELKLHVRTHILPHTTEKRRQKDSEPEPSVKYVRYLGWADEQQQPAGIPLLAALIIRNLAQAIQEAILSPSKIKQLPKKNTTVYDTEGESILLQLDRAAKEATDYVHPIVSEEDDPTAREGVGPEAGAPALVLLEDDIYRWMVDEPTLGQILGEVVVIIRNVAEWKERRDKEENMMEM
ncbi:hypothetical protein BT69DRAFT_1338518 [Atractiella rhizophila]|nr:hypothetical protein BT69DRAFT_1338518 [Atractiella rhizophila]